jgi:hypothetical protein
LIVAVGIVPVIFIVRYADRALTLRNDSARRSSA